MRGFYFGATLGALAALTLIFMVRRPSVEQMETGRGPGAERSSR